MKPKVPSGGQNTPGIRARAGAPLRLPGQLIAGTQGSSRLPVATAASASLAPAQSVVAGDALRDIREVLPSS